MSGGEAYFDGCFKEGHLREAGADKEKDKEKEKDPEYLGTQGRFTHEGGSGMDAAFPAPLLVGVGGLWNGGKVNAPGWLNALKAESRFDLWGVGGGGFSAGRVTEEVSDGGE